MDCDDTDSSYNPGAVDIWYDGYDHDCAGNSDYDADADGYDSDAYAGTDCEDADWAVNPGATEVWYDGVDSDCDAASDYDADGDGEDSDAYSGVDCDDADSAVNTSATEECDGLDNDCDGNTDFGICGEWSLDAFVQIDGQAAYDFTTNPSVGDFDGDGMDDLLVAANGHGSGSNSIDYGAVYLFYGPLTADTDTSTADWWVYGSSGDGLGGKAGVADLDGDGYDDFMIGAPYDGNDTGEALIYLGSVTRRSGYVSSGATFSSNGYYGRIYGTEYQDFLNGSSVPIGDIDGDGLTDLGLPFVHNDDGSGNDNHGSVLLIMSGTSTLTGGAWHSINATDINGQSSDGFFGNIASAGDVDGDGHNDLMVGAANPSWAAEDPRVYLIYGGQSGLSSAGTVDVASFTHSQIWEHSSLSVDEAFTIGDGGDLNADGYSDLVLRDKYAADTLGNQVGHVYIILGSATRASNDYVENLYDLTIWGSPSAVTTNNTRFGETLALTTDRDGDGTNDDLDLDSDSDPDLVVGQNDNTDGGVFVFTSESLQGHLSAGTTMLVAEMHADAILRQPNPSDEARDIAFGDLDGDGSTDLIVGSSGYDAGGATSTGAIFIVPGTLK